MKSTFTYIYILTVIQLSGASFQNLGFDSARTDAITLLETNGLSEDVLKFYKLGSGFGAVRDLLPGWSLRKGSQPLETIGVNTPSILASDYVTLLDANGFEEPSKSPVEGVYGIGFIHTSPGDYYLSQVAEIPENGKLLSFRTSGNPLLVSINGTDIGEPFGVGNSFTTTKTFDISQFSGQQVELTFRTAPQTPVGGGAYSFIDSISFSIPEPSTYALLVLGAGLLGGRYWWQRRKGAMS